MSAIIAALWPILTSYRPGAARTAGERKPGRFGAFIPTYTPLLRRPRNDVEAQRLYNHTRTVAYWLDAAPLLTDLGLPFRAGLDDIIGLVPLYGDIVSGILQLYQLWLAWLFGVPRDVLLSMLFNVILDVVVGIVPIIGDILDNLFKANLRNLALLETWLLTSSEATARYHILLMPDTGDYLPKPRGARRWSSWFGGEGESDVKERERATGKVRATRRMTRDEADFGFGVGPVPMPAHDPLD